MKPHNLDRHAVLKRKREEAEEESRARLAKVQSEKDARAANRRRAEAEKPLTASKKPQKGPRRGKPGSRNKSRRDRVVPGPEGVAGPKVIGTPSLETRNENTGDKADVSTDDHGNGRSQKVLTPLFLTAKVEAEIRRLSSERNEWKLCAKDAVSGPSGIEELGSVIDDGEIEGYDTTESRALRQSKREYIDRANAAIAQLDKEIASLRKMQTAYNSVLYDLANFSRDNDRLNFLPNEFWQSFEESRAVNALCQQLKLERRRAKQEERNRAMHAVEQAGPDVHHTSAETGISSSQAAVEDGQEAARERLQAHQQWTLQTEQLADLLQQARSRFLEVESTLISIAYDSLERNKLPRTGDDETNAAEANSNAVSSNRVQTEHIGGEADVERRSLQEAHGEKAGIEPADEDEGANVDRQPLAESTQGI